MKKIRRSTMRVLQLVGIGVILGLMCRAGQGAYMKIKHYQEQNRSVDFASINMDVNMYLIQCKRKVGVETYMIFIPEDISDKKRYAEIFCSL